MAVTFKAKGGLTRVNKGGTTYDMRDMPVANGYATALFNGDPVKVSAGYVGRAIAGDKIVGIFRGAYYINSEGQPTHRPYLPASTSSAGQIGSYNSPVALVEEFKGSDDVVTAAVNAAIGQANVGDLYALKFGTGDTRTGNSALVVDTSAGAVTTAADAAVRFIGKVDQVGNEFTDTDMVGLFQIVNPGYNA